MNNQTKVLIGVGLVAVILYLASNPKSKLSSSILKLMDDDTTLTAMSNLNVCSKGEIPCKNDNTKCYDPNSNYYVDPCRISQGIQENF